jgi:hypothetical protein
MARVPLHDGGFVSWDEKGKTVVGVFVGIEESTKYPGGHLTRLQTDTGKIAVATPATLYRALQGVAIGTKLEIEYLGETPSKVKGRSGLKKFAVYALTTD